MHHASNRIGQKDKYDCDWTYLSSGMHLARSPISPLRAAIRTSSLIMVQRFVCFISLDPGSRV